MWIIPKNISDTYPSVVDTKELGLDCEEFSAKSERYLMWRSKPSQSPTWLRRWKRIKFLQHLSGRILKHSHTKSFLEKWTSSLGDSHVNLFPMQEAEKELKTQDTSTPTSVMESGDVDQDLFSWKTLKESSVPKQKQDEVFCSMCSKTWKEWVTSQRQEYSQRVKLAHLTRENECSSWPTPTARDVKGPSGRAYKNKPENLADIELGNWPTPTAMEAGKIGNCPNYGQLGLSNHPKVHGYEVQREKLHKDRKGKPKAKDGPADQEKTNATGKHRGQYLNPNFVEQLMGLPVGWTDLGSWETESYPKQ